MLRVVLFGVLLGLVNCDLTCFINAHADCNLEMVKLIQQGGKTDECSIKPKLLECMKKGAADCNMELSAEIDKVISVYKKVCEEGSKLNNDYKKLQPCFVRAAMASLSCFQEIIDFAKNTPNPTPDQMVEIQKFTCSKFDKTMDCFFSTTASTCGRDGYAFLKFMMDPEIALTKKVCKVFLKDGVAEVSLPFFMPTMMMI